MVRNNGVAATLFAALMVGAAFGDDSTGVPRTPAEVKRSDECDQVHADLRKKNPEDARALRDAWVAEKPRCGGTGLYEYLLGHDERRAGNNAAAAAIFEDSVKRKLPYYESSFVTLTMMRGETALKAQPPDMQKVRELRDELARFVSAHKPDAFAYQQLAAIGINLKDWPAVIEAARKSIELDASYGKARRYLVFALHASKRCAEAVPEIRPAIEVSRELLADPQFMIPAVDCYAETGDRESGEAALHAFLRANPAMKDDKLVIQLQEYFAAHKPSEPAAK